MCVLHYFLSLQRMPFRQYFQKDKCKLCKTISAENMTDCRIVLHRVQKKSGTFVFPCISHTQFLDKFYETISEYP